jgi:threonine/homoserine/homoserine lactone efflux protein
MPAFSTLLPFFGISLVMGLAPGPDNLFVLMQSATRGSRAGMVIVIGLCSGLLVQTAMVAAGLGTLLTASKLALDILKTAGALYLAWLGWQALRSTSARPAAGAEPLQVTHLYRRGLLMNLSNPKVIIFFLAFLPQFVAHDRGNVAFQMAALGLVFVMASLLVFSGIAYFAGMGAERLLGSARAQRTLNIVAGVVFIALALKLLIAHF